jgi:hypothetical protein
VPISRFGRRALACRLGLAASKVTATALIRWHKWVRIEHPSSDQPSMSRGYANAISSSSEQESAQSVRADWAMFNTRHSRGVLPNYRGGVIANREGKWPLMVE